MAGLGKNCTARHTISVENGVSLSVNRRNTGEAPGRRHLLGLHAVEEDVLDVLFVLADVLDDVRVRQQDERHGHRPRLRVRLRIVERELDLEMTVVDAAKLLRRPHLFAARMPAYTEPALVVEADCLDDERVALPFAEGVAEPRGLALGGVVATVGEDLSEL